MTRLAFPLALAAGALCIATAAQAQVYKFSPPSTTFTASGPASITKGEQVQCTMTMKMRTNAKGHLKILSTKFSGDSGCGTGENLPWKVKQPTFNSAMIMGFEFTSPFGDCSYPQVPMFLDAGTIIIGFQFPDCGAGLGAELTTSPTLSLVAAGAD